MVAELSVAFGEFKAANTYKLSAEANGKTVPASLDDMNAQRSCWLSGAGTGLDVGTPPDPAYSQSFRNTMRHI